MMYNNQNYYGGYTPMFQQSQFQNQLQSQPSQMQASILSPGVSGRVIDDISTVSASEVPMNGEQAVFIMRDGSSVYTKRWLANGNIATTQYLPQTNASDIGVNNLAVGDVEGKFEPIYERLQAIEEKLDVIAKPATPKRTTKKEVVGNE